MSKRKVYDDYRETEIYNDGYFKITEFQRRGYKPFYELWRLKKIFWWSYWSWCKWSDEKENLINFIKRWEDWERYDDWVD